MPQRSRADNGLTFPFASAVKKEITVSMLIPCGE